MKPYPITEKRSSELAKIRDVKAESLRTLVNDLASAEPVISVEAFTLLLQKRSNEEQSQALSTFLVGMRRNADGRKINGEEMIEAISAGLKESKWTTAQLDAWAERAPFLARLLEAKVLKVVVKASYLYYNHPQHFHDLRIITDVLPVFDEDRTQIISYIIKNKLHMVISDTKENEDHTEIPIGIDDLHGLKREIDIALSKTTKLATDLSKQSKVPTRTYGDEDH